jgi:rhodanese-related sulfurtransferase
VRTLQFLGFTAVAELSGGLQAWKSIGGATEGTKD